MRRRNRIRTTLTLGAAAAVVVGGLGLVLKQEPSFYAAALTADRSQDPFVGAEVFTRLGDLQNDIRREPEWRGAFTADELNAFLTEYAGEGGLLDLLPDNTYDPRVAIEGDRLTIAARQRYFGLDGLSTVVSIELRAWMVNEVNAVAIEVCDMRVGAMPWRAQPWLDKVTEQAHRWNTDVTWYRHDGHPVGVFRFYANQPRPTTQVTAIGVGDGQVMVAGRTTIEPGPR